MFLFSDGLSLIISRLPLISIKYFLFSWAKIMKVSREGKKLQWSKWSQTALLFDGLTIFSVRGGTNRSIYLSIYLSIHTHIYIYIYMLPRSSL